MKRKHLAVLATTCAVLICLVVMSAYAGESQDKQATTNVAKQLLSVNRQEREEAFNKLTLQYLDVEQELLESLQQAATKNKSDDRYHSPLHCAILAVDACHVLEADKLLFSVIDYELDMNSLPSGIDVRGEYFYPAASALVGLRVDTKAVLQAIGEAKNEKQLRVLTWVLSQRTEKNEAKRLLGKAADEKMEAEKKNLTKAVELIEKNLHDSDILPRLSAGSKSSR